VTSQRAYVGLGTNLGDRAENLAAAFAGLGGAGRVRRRSAIYRTRPWGRTDQPDFYNAVVEIETTMTPRELLDALQRVEQRLGRAPGERWGPRAIDLDILTYDDRIVDREDLQIPHPLIAKRAFVLVPLAELDIRFAAWRDALGASEIASVVPLDGDELARFECALRESGIDMQAEESSRAAHRVRALADFLKNSDAVRLRIERADEEIELSIRRAHSGGALGTAQRHAAEALPARVDTIRADIVGIFHFSRPAPAAGDVVDDDRDLGYIEALGIRTPVHSLGAGRLLAIAAADETPVEYGQALFVIARG
jgi:2-amino-4-hydroxy-6-hydroxymethyldihydropteridine diphosphokinase